MVHIPATSCALADLPFSRGLCLPAACFPSYVLGSFVAAREFGCSNGVFRQCMRGLCEGLWHGCGAHTCPILCTCKPSFLSWVMSPRHVFPSRVILPSSQPVSLVGQMAFIGNACEGCVRGCGMAVVHIPASSCALADIPFSPGLCLPATCFHPVSFFLRHSK